MLYRTHLDRFELTTLVVIGPSGIGRCKSNYHSVVVTLPLPTPNHHSNWFLFYFRVQKYVKQNDHIVIRLIYKS